jgi:hypothetical protein
VVAKAKQNKRKVYFIEKNAFTYKLQTSGKKQRAKFKIFRFLNIFHIFLVTLDNET